MGQAREMLKDMDQGVQTVKQPAKQPAKKDTISIGQSEARVTTDDNTDPDARQVNTVKAMQQHRRRA